MQIRSGKSTPYSTARVRPNTNKAAEQRRAWPRTPAILIGAAGILLAGAGFLFTKGAKPISPGTGQPLAMETAAAPTPRAIKVKAAPTPPAQPAATDNPWEGPVLYHAPGSAPFHLILVEKAVQKLHLYRYDGRYQRIKTYGCATGENQGQKKVENDL